MGLFRLFLASLVLISHLGISIAGINPGVSAVVVFYLLAGSVVARLWRRRPGQGLVAGALWFYHDRAWRILPLYFFCMAIALLVWLLGATSPFLSRPPQAAEWLANLTIIPLNYYMFSGVDAFTLLPPAWSLGVELQFYLLVPLLLGFPLLAGIAGVLSLLVFALAQLGWLNTDIFGYRLLAGVGFVFLAGTLLGQSSRLARWLLGGLWLASLGYLLALLAVGRHVPYNLEVALGLVLGLPLLVALQRLHLAGRWERLQRLAGELSYGLFLLHFPVIWALQLVGIAGPKSAWLVWLLSAALAWLGHLLVERPLWRRHRPWLAAKPPRIAADGCRCAS